LRDILKGLVRYPLGLLPQIPSKGVTNVLYPKGVMKGPTIGGVAYFNWNDHNLCSKYSFKQFAYYTILYETTFSEKKIYHIAYRYIEVYRSDLCFVSVSMNECIHCSMHVRMNALIVSICVHEFMIMKYVLFVIAQIFNENTYKYDILLTIESITVYNQAIFTYWYFSQCFVLPK
jgi:hypothetical protein